MHSHALAAALASLIAGSATAQTFTVLHHFTAYNSNNINSDGAEPSAGLVLSGNTLYGTTLYGGSSGGGTVFKIATDGAGFSNLHSFTSTQGFGPLAALILNGNTLYGTAWAGGGGVGGGTVFALKTNGTGFVVLHTFTGYLDGENPLGGLVLSGNNLYGTTSNGSTPQGQADGGTLFRVSTNGTGFAILFTFFPSTGDSFNGDGASGRLLVSGATLYGTAAVGGSDWAQSGGYGTIFKINTDGSLFTILHNFTATSNDGAKPYSGLILSGNALYGTTEYGGSSGNGTVFKVNTDGSEFVTLHSFAALVSGTNSDGANPYAGLFISGNALYGAATSGGSSGNGTVFSLNTDGTGFTNLHSFSAGDTNSSGVLTNSDGSSPKGTLTLATNTLYGTAYMGGLFGSGAVFSITLPVVQPQLTVTPVGSNVILTWPTTPIGFNLEATTDLRSPVIWTAVSSPPVLVNGLNAVTNPISGKQQFYRLAQ